MNVYGKQVVHPWLCDSMGHLSTRHYMAMFDDASYHLLAECSGWTPNASEGEWRGKGWADVRHIVQYQAEVLAGSLIEICGRIEELGNSSVSYRLEMRELGKEIIAATFEAKTVFFDLFERRSMPLTEEMRARLQVNMQ